VNAGTHPEASFGELLGELGQKTGTLVRQEVQLARTELSAQANRAARELAVLAVAGALALAGLLGVLAAIVVALAAALPLWLAALIVGGVVLAAGLALLQRGMGRLRRMDPLPRTVETLRDDKALLQEHVQ
jgi:uncharacterized membrane protein YqjE